MTKESRFVRQYRPDWQQTCDNCGQKPVVPVSGLCGCCHWGTVDALNGGWWDESTNNIDAQFAKDHLPEARAAGVPREAPPR